MMKLNQLLMSFLFILGLTNTTLQAVKAIKGAATAAGFVGRIMTNRANPQEERIFMAVNAGAQFLELINGLLKATPTRIEEGQSPTFMQTLSIAITGHATISDALRSAGQQNLDSLATWFKTKQVTELIKSLNPEIAEHLSLEEKKNALTPEQKNQVEKFESTFEKATGPAIRWLKGTSKPYERVAIWLVLKTVSLINRFRNKFTSGRKLDDTSAMITEATAFVTEQAVNTAFRMAERGLEYVQQTVQNITDSAREVVNSTLTMGGELLTATAEVATGTLMATAEVVHSSVRAVTDGLSTILDGVQEEANAALESITGGVVSGVVHGVDLLVHFMNWLNGPEDVFYDAYEALTPLQKLFTDYEAVLSEMLPYGDSFSGALKRIMEKNQQIIKEKGATKETLDLLFSNIDKTIEETTLRKIDLTDFSKLPDPLKAKIVDAWKNAKSQDLVEALVNLQAKDIDKGLLEVIGKNAEWKELKPEELIQIPEALYEFLSITTLAQIEKALKATPKDFDTINKLTTLSFVTDNAWKNATAQELLDFPTEFYTELSEAHLKQIEKQINLTDAQLPLEAQINNPYQKQITLLEVEQAKRASAINNDSQSIQKQAADAQKQQADQVAQHTATTPTQTTPETSGTATNQELPNFDTIPSRPRSDSTTSADFHDPHETAEEFQKAHEKELLEKQAQEEAAKKRAEQAIKEHEIAAEHAATQVHGL